MGTFTIEDTIPIFTSFVSADPECTSNDGKTLTWVFENVEDGDEKSVSFKVKVDANVNGDAVVNESILKYGNNETKTSNKVRSFTPVRHDPPVLKTVTGDDPEKDETFTFKLEAVRNTAGTDNPMPEGSTGKTKTIEAEVGTPEEFGDIIFRTPGEYWYEISEVDTGLEGYEYDDTVYTLHYVLAVKDSALVMNLTTTDSDGNVVPDAENSFENKYTVPEEPEEPEEPEKPGKKPKTGDNNNLAGWLALMALAGAGGAGLYVRRRRHDDEE